MSVIKVVGLLGSILLLSGYSLLLLSMLGYTLEALLDSQPIVEASVWRSLSIASLILYVLGFVLLFISIYLISRETRRASVMINFTLSILSILLAIWGFFMLLVAVSVFNVNIVVGLALTLTIGIGSLFLMIAGVLGNGVFLWLTLSQVADATGVSLFKAAGLAFIARSLLLATFVFSLLAPLAELIGLFILALSFYSMDSDSMRVRGYRVIRVE